jgi:branched-chain amino acid aminotransferase
MLSQSTFFVNLFNFNGSIIDTVDFTDINRVFLYGDGIFDTLLIIDSKIIFAEDHYFRLLKGMRLLRMEIPIFFTQNFWENEIHRLLIEKKIKNARVRTTIFRKGGGLYLPKVNDINFLIQAEVFTEINTSNIKIGIYKEQTLNQNSLNNVKSTNKLVHVLASIFADENEYDNVLLLNNHKRVVSVVNGNIFIIKENTVKTPLLSEGCVEGIIRKKIVTLLKKSSDYVVTETELNLFDLIQADEIFYTNSIIGAQGIQNFKNRIYATKQSSKINEIIKSLN